MTDDKKKDLEEQVYNVRCFKEVFATEHGEKVLKYLKRIGHFDTSTVAPDDKRDLSLWREGRRSIVLDIIKIKDMDLEKFRRRYEKEMKKKEQDQLEQGDDSWVF